MFCWLIYRPGPGRISEGLLGSVRTSDGTATRLHIARWQGGKDRLRCRWPGWTLESHCVCFLGTTHRHPRFVSQSGRPAKFIVRIASAHRWMPAALQAALKAARLECGLRKRGGFTRVSLRHGLRTHLLDAGNGPAPHPVPARGTAKANHHRPATPTHQGESAIHQPADRVLNTHVVDARLTSLRVDWMAGSP